MLLPDVGLNDLTLLPAVPAELARTGSIAPSIRRHLAEAGYEVKSPVADRELRDGVTSGYLAAHPEAAAAAARRADADWIAVVRLTKPSFLFCYVVVDVVDARSGRSAGNSYVELKGPMGDTKLTERGAQELAARIDRMIRRTPPALAAGEGR
ncbi:MAG: DUF2380 domain-containing protein [Gammaproteobacteria bacterium]|nr:DUF2380 domain-containing protein [Gammaproteobacteria bacterium]